MNLTARAKIEICKVLAEEEALINKKLPKELLLRIFSYLDVVSLCRCAQVSKAWNILALDGSNWQRIDLFNFQTDIEGDVVENISKRCGGFLKKLSLRGCQSVEDAALKTFAQNCNHIEELNLNDCKKLTDSTCQNLSKYCPKLMHLDVGSCSQMTDASLRAIGSNTDERLTPSVCKYIMLTADEIKRKRIDPKVKNRVIPELHLKCKTKEQNKVYSAKQKRERDGCPNMEHINISWCSQVSVKGVEALARGCVKLKAFICKGCSLIGDDAIQELTRYCPDLQVINLLGCNAITDEAVQYISQRCPKLHYLCLSNCNHLTDTSLIALGQGCHNLRTLEVAGCSLFTDSGFQALAKNCHFLENMDLEECVLITDNTLCYLAAGCPRLQKLSLSHCELITDEGLRHLGTSACSSDHLSVLELDNCPLITDQSLDHLITCHSLQRIELYDCQLITRAGIRKLRGHLPDLKVHAYFAPLTPPPSAVGGRPRYCRCCVIL